MASPSLAKRGLQLGPQPGLQPGLQKGASLFEFVVVVVVVVLLASYAYVRLAKQIETVERVDFERTLNRMQAQLTLNVASWYVQGRRVNRSALESANPVSLIATPPDNYAGELKWSQLQQCPLGRWCYVQDRHWLVYRVEHGSALDNPYQHPDVLIYTLHVSFFVPGAEQGQATALTLRPVHRFEWQSVVYE